METNDSIRNPFELLAIYPNCTGMRGENFPGFVAVIVVARHHTAFSWGHLRHL